MSILLPLLVIFALLVANGLFVAAEFAFVGASRARIDRLAEEGHAAAAAIAPVLRDPGRQDLYIATAQLGITIASLGLGMYGEHLVADWLYELIQLTGLSRWLAAHTVASVLAVTVLTYLHIVIGEMIPKSLALQAPEATVLRLSWPMKAFNRLFMPLVILLNGIGNRGLAMFGIKRGAHSEQAHSAAELQQIVEESQEEGLLRAESGSMILELFDFGGRTAAEAMVPRVQIVGIPLDASATHLAEFIRTAAHTRYPVYHVDFDHILGMLHIKDVLRLLLADRSLQEADIRPIPFLPHTATLDEVLAIMRTAQTQLAVVMDEFGGTAGLISIEDLFEEITGDMSEAATAPTKIDTDARGRIHVLGTARLDELGDYMDRDLDDEQVDTVSGLILMHLNRPAAVGDRITYRGLALTVEALDGRGVQSAWVERAEPGAAPADEP